MKKPKIISMVNNKGGVGKTFLTLNIASSFADDYKTLIIDNEAQNNVATTLFSEFIDIIEGGKTIAEAYEGKDCEIIKVFDDEKTKGFNKQLFLLPSNREKMKRFEIELPAKFGKDKCKVLLKLNEFLREKLSEFDFVFIDCPPGLNVFTYNALNLSDYVIIPLKPGKNELIGVENLLNTLDDIQKESGHKVKLLGTIINQYDESKKLMGQFFDALDSIFSEEMIFNNIVPYSIFYERSTWEGLPFDLKFNFTTEKLDTKYNVFKRIKKEILDKI
jgi:chromosome partitioning protein